MVTKLIYVHRMIYCRCCKNAYFHTLSVITVTPMPNNRPEIRPAVDNIMEINEWWLDCHGIKIST